MTKQTYSPLFSKKFNNKRYPFLFQRQWGNFSSVILSIRPPYIILVWIYTKVKHYLIHLIILYNDDSSEYKKKLQ